MKNIIKTMALGLASSLFLTAAYAQETVRYATDGDSMGASIILASEKGYLKEEGIDSIVQTFAYGMDTVDAVLAGQADFGVVIGFPLLTRFGADKLSAPAIIAQFPPGWHKLYSTTDLQDQSNFKGKTFGVATGTAQDFVTRSYLETLGLDPEKDVTLVNFTDLFSIVGALKGGRLDAAWIWGEGVPVIDEDDKFAFISDDSIVSEGASALLVSSKDFAEEHPDLVVKTLKALQKATLDIESDLSGSATIVAKKIGADVTKIERSIGGVDYELNYSTESVATLRSQYQFLIDAEKMEAYDLGKYITGSLLAQAVPSAKVDPSLK